MLTRVREAIAVPPGLKPSGRPSRPAPAAVVLPAEPSPLHEAILAWLALRG
jgi:hypothetical protein